MPTINVNDAYVLNETGAEVDKVTGLFTKDENATSGEKQMARLNIAAGGSNRNLLNNPFFTVRQRGDGPFSGANTFAMDRWRATSNSTITCTTNGITITTTVKKWGMQYRVTKDFFIVGKVYTISALEQDGTITNATFTWTGSGLSLYPTGSNVGFEVSTSNGSYDIIYFTTSEVGSVYLRAVKLELGSVSTLANDTPPDYGTELAKCQRYFLRITRDGSSDTLVGCGYARTTTSGVVELPLPTTMRAITSVSVNGTIGAIVNGTLQGSVSAFIYYSQEANIAIIQFTLASSTTQYAPVYLLLRSSGAYIDLSADL